MKWLLLSFVVAGGFNNYPTLGPYIEDHGPIPGDAPRTSSERFLESSSLWPPRGIFPYIFPWYFNVNILKSCNVPVDLQKLEIRAPERHRHTDRDGPASQWSAGQFFSHPGFLVGGWAYPSENMKVSWDYYSQYMEK